VILAVHSSPHLGGNLERMVLRVAESSGLEYELMRLAELNISFCKGCVRCARSKRCVQKDDMALLYKRLESAQGLIIGGLNYNGRFNSLAHTFLERLFPLYHLEPSLKDTPAALVAVGGENPERASRDIAGYLKEISMGKIVGVALFKSDTPPCFSCGLGPECPVGMPALNWATADFKAFTTVKKEMFQRFEHNSDAVDACYRLGQMLNTAVNGNWSRPTSGGGYYLLINREPFHPPFPFHLAEAPFCTHLE